MTSSTLQLVLTALAPPTTSRAAFSAPADLVILPPTVPTTTYVRTRSTTPSLIAPYQLVVRGGSTRPLKRITTTTTTTTTRQRVMRRNAQVVQSVAGAASPRPVVTTTAPKPSTTAVTAIVTNDNREVETENQQSSRPQSVWAATYGTFNDSAGTTSTATARPPADSSDASSALFGSSDASVAASATSEGVTGTSTGIFLAENDPFKVESTSVSGSDAVVEDPVATLQDLSPRPQTLPPTTTPPPAECYVPTTPLVQPPTAPPATEQPQPQSWNKRLTLAVTVPVPATNMQPGVKTTTTVMTPVLQNGGWQTVIRRIYRVQGGEAAGVPPPLAATREQQPLTRPAEPMGAVAAENQEAAGGVESVTVEEIPQQTLEDLEARKQQIIDSVLAAMNRQMELFKDGPATHLFEAREILDNAQGALQTARDLLDECHGLVDAVAAPSETTSIDVMPITPAEEAVTLEALAPAMDIHPIAAESQEAAATAAADSQTSAMVDSSSYQVIGGEESSSVAISSLEAQASEANSLMVEMSSMMKSSDDQMSIMSVSTSDGLLASEVENVLSIPSNHIAIGESLPTKQDPSVVPLKVDAQVVPIH